LSAQTESGQQQSTSKQSLFHCFFGVELAGLPAGLAGLLAADAGLAAVDAAGVAVAGRAGAGVAALAGTLF
jgi:hypothetical protein